jgi:hypothetical protein
MADLAGLPFRIGADMQVRLTHDGPGTFPLNVGVRPAQR